jgi:O-antigen ligase/tetratricopeptide (TPR) repeat protein
MVAGIPLLVVRAANHAINVPKLTVLMMGTTLVLALRLAETVQGRSPTGLTRLRIPALAIALPLLLSWTVNPYREWTLFGEYGRFQGLIPSLVVIVFGVLVADAFEGEQRSLVWAVAGAAGATGALATLQATGLDPLAGYTARPEGTGAIATFGNTNFSGGFMAISLPIAVTVAWTERRRAALAWVIVGTIAVGLALTQSQGGWAAGLVGLVVLGGYILSQRHRVWKLVGALALVFVALALVATVVFADAFGASTGRVREELWKEARLMGADSLLVGHGPNSFGFKSPQYRGVRSVTLEDRGEEVYADDPHSLPHAAFANLGLVGLGGLLLAIGWTVQRARRVEGDHLVAVAFVAALAGYITQALVSIDEISLRLLLWTALGGLVAAGVRAPVRQGKAKTTRSSRRRQAVSLRMPAVLGLIAMGTLALLVLESRFFLADARFKQARLQIGTDPQLAIETAQHALELRDEYEYRHALGYELGRYAVTRGIDAHDTFHHALNLFSHVPDFPDPLAIRDKGSLLAAWAEFEPSAAQQGAELLLGAAELDPYGQETRVYGARALRLAGQEGKAEAHLLDYLELNDRSAEVWAELALVRAYMGDRPGVEEAVARANDLEPGLPTTTRAMEVLDEMA